MGEQDERLLKTDVTLHLNETRDNITNCLTMHTKNEILRQTIDEYHPTLWWQVEVEGSDNTHDSQLHKYDTVRITSFKLNI
jgi:hypothetical protein